MKNRPLISFTLFAYNQEQYIGEAIEGAFAQTYSPLEIILSDDGSTDRTFERMEHMAKNYHGPHKLILNRNEPNVGLIEHVNKVVTKIAKGEVIVVAAGDDISLPERVVNTWQVFEDDPGISSVSMSYQHIDENSRPLKTDTKFLNGYFTLEDYLTKKRFPQLGCTRAYKKTVLEVFGKLEPSCGVEDSTLVFRSLLLGKSYHLANVGVHYRNHPKSMSKGINFNTAKGIIKQRIKDSKSALQLGLIVDNTYEEIKRTVISLMYVNCLRTRYFRSGNNIVYYLAHIFFNREFLYKEKLELLKMGVKSKVNILKNIVIRST